MKTLKNIHDFPSVDEYELWVEENLTLFTDEQLLIVFSEIEESHKQYSHNLFVDYCVRDTGVILAIDGKRCFIDLILMLCYYAKIPFNAVLGTIKIWDAILFNSLREEHKVVPESVSHHKEAFIGAFVKEPLPGAHRYIMSFDLTALDRYGAMDRKLP